MVEDVGVFKELNVVTWLMLACQHGYSPTMSQRAWCRGLVCQLASATTCMRYVVPNGSRIRIGRHLPIEFTRDMKNILYSLQLNQSHLSPGGDKNMFDTTIRRLYMMSSEALVNERDISSIPSLSPLLLSCPDKKLGVDDFILPSIDFHCVPNILNMITDDFDQYTEQQVKAAIWVHSSSVTNKTTIDRPG